MTKLNYNIASIVDKKMITFFIALLLSSISFPQPTWKTFYNGSQINRIVSKGKDLWAGTNVGLVYINLETDELKLYDKSNSEIDLSQSTPFLIKNTNELIFSKPYYFGLISFNGKSFEEYGPEDVRTAAQDKNGDLWVGFSYGGLKKLGWFNGSSIATVEFYSNNSPLPSDDVRKIRFDKNWNQWIATYEYDDRTTLNAGIAKYDGKKWTIYNKKNSPIETNQITDLVIDKNENIWIGTEKESVYRFSNNVWTRFDIKGPDKFPSTFSQVTSMAVDSSNNIWVGTFGNGIYRYDGKAWKIYDGYNSKLRSSMIISLEVDYKGRLWVGTEIGLYRFENGDFKEFSTSNSTIPTPILKKAVKDKKGNIWIVTEDYGSPFNSTKNNNGIVRFNGKEFSYLNIKDICNDCFVVNSLVVDLNDNLWIATNKGLFKYDGSNIIPFTERFKSDFQAECMCIDYFGNIWMGEADGKIYKFDGVNLTRYTPDQQAYPIGWISSIYHDGRYIWAGGLFRDKPLLKIDPIKSGDRLVNEKIDIPVSQVSSIVMDKQGTLWVSSFEDGIARYKDSKWEVLNKSNFGILSEKVSSMIIDERQRMIFGCRESRYTPGAAPGVSIFNGYSLTNYSYDKSKLGISFIYSALTDKNGNIWAIGNNGISIYNPDSQNINWELRQEFESKLFQNFPNPCNPETVIKYSLASPSKVQIKIYDLLGREIRTIVNKQNETGSYYVLWDGKNNHDQLVSSGMYIYSLITDEGVQNKKLILLR